MRARRLLSLLELLEARGRTTADDLAVALGVSVRTIYRDKDALAGSGVPVRGDRGPDGGYLLEALPAADPGPRGRADLPAATAEIGLARILAGVGPRGGPGSASTSGPTTTPGPATAVSAPRLPELPAPRRPVPAAPAAELDDRARRLADRFHLDVPGGLGAVELVPTLTGLADAVWNRRAVRVRVRRPGAEGAREVELHPLGLVRRAGSWYLVSVDPGDGRAHRPTALVHPLARLEELAVLDARFERPPGFDLHEAWVRASTTALGGPVVATLRLSPRGRALAPAVLRPPTAQALAASAGPPDATGWCRAEVPVESVAQASGELLALGAEVEVLSPAPLRRRMRELAAGLAALYG